MPEKVGTDAISVPTQPILTKEFRG